MENKINSIDIEHKRKSINCLDLICIDTNIKFNSNNSIKSKTNSNKHFSLKNYKNIIEASGFENVKALLLYVPEIELVEVN